MGAASAKDQSVQNSSTTAPTSTGCPACPACPVAAQTSSSSSVIVIMFIGLILFAIGFALFRFVAARLPTRNDPGGEKNRGALMV